MKVLVTRTNGEWVLLPDDALRVRLNDYFPRCKGFGITHINVADEDLITSRCVDDRAFFIPGETPPKQMGLF